MIKLYTTDGTLLSYAIRDTSPLMMESIMIENKLLDGSIHVQSIGDGFKFYEFTLVSNEIQVDIITPLQSEGGLFRLELDGKYYIGLMEEPRWKRETVRTYEKEGRLFSSSIKIKVVEDGLI